MGPSGLRPGHERNTRLWTPRNVVLQGDNVAVQGTEVKKLPLGRPAKGSWIQPSKKHENVQFLTSNSKWFFVKTQIISNSEDWAK